MSKRICFITPSHISSNPRLIKEVQSLTNKGHQITILFAQTLDYLKFEDEKILKNICKFVTEYAAKINNKFVPGFFSAAKKDYLKKSKNGHFYKCPKMSKIEISWGL